MAVNNVANMLMGPASLYIGALGQLTPIPSLSLINQAPTVAASGQWTDLGGTDGGCTFEVNPKFSQIQCDQIVDTVDERMTSRSIQVTATLSEVTLSNLAVSLNCSVGSTGANYAVLVPQYDAYTSQTPKVSLIMDGLAPAAVPNARRRIYLPRAQQVGAIKPQYEKTKQVGFAVQFTAYYVSSTQPPFQVVDQTA